MHRTRLRLASVPGLLLVLLVACGGVDDTAPDVGGQPTDDVEAPGDAPTDDTDAPPAAGACLEGDPDCVDTVVVDPDADALDEGAILREAEALLGVAEDDLAGRDTVRVGRRGDEQYMLTEDYVIGRMTVGLDDDGTDTYRVVEVVVELTDGPITLPESR